jgi:hypothetical protein
VQSLHIVNKFHLNVQMAAEGGQTSIRVKVCGKEEVLNMTVAAGETMEDLARQVGLPACCCALHCVTFCRLKSSVAACCSQVRKSQDWDVQQHMRFISSGQELFMDDSASKALGSVLHCIASQSPAQKFLPPKTGHGQKGVQHSAAVDWVSNFACAFALELCLVR